MLSPSTDEESVPPSEDISEARSYSYKYRYRLKIIDDKLWKYEFISENRWKVYPKDDPAHVRYENDKGEEIK